MTDRRVILDTETTGLDAKNGDRVIEIGCVEMIDWTITENFFHVYLNPEREISKGATKVHGMTLDQLLDKPKFIDVAQQFTDFIKDDYIVAHNANFDVRFLNSELMRAKKRNIIKPNKVIDTLQIARNMFPGSPASLDALCKRFKISLEQRKMHGALLDAQLLARVYMELSKGKQSNFEFITKKQSSGEKNKEITHKSRDFKNTEEEDQRHKNFILQIKDPIWLKAKKGCEN